MTKRIITIAAILLLVGAGCGSSSSEYSGSETRHAEPENPYSPGSGHAAGFEWAERTGGNCSGNSPSFNEGCEEYYEQLGR